MSSPLATLVPQPSADASALDRRLVGLRHDHGRHLAGPIVPCPFCFDPFLEFSVAATAPRQEPVSSVPPIGRAAAA